MTFTDLLRQARSSRVAVLHEFLAQYDPKQRRVHMFCEDHDDEVFYRRFLNAYVSPEYRLIPYPCGGKARVYEAFTQITQRLPNSRDVLFFVDKDLDDILGVPWPTDPRIFVTDVYSIENYFVTKDVLDRLYRDLIRLRGVNFAIQPVLDRFEKQLARFHSLALPLMAWIVTVRRKGLKPVLSDVNIGELFSLSEGCHVRVKPCERVEYLTRVSGVVGTAGISRRVLATCRELKRIPSKRVMRGKFEAWFFVRFWKNLVDELRKLAKEAGGSLGVAVAVEQSSFVAVLLPHLTIPRPLELFLGQHFPSSFIRGADFPAPVAPPGWTNRILAALKRVLGSG